MAEALDPETIEFAHQMFELAREGQTEQLAGMVDMGLPVNLTNDSGDTLLILAAYHAHVETVAALLGLGADHDRMNDRGQTALGSATFRKDNASIAVLLKAGADPTSGTQSAIDVAKFFGLTEQLALLTRS